MVPAGVPSPLPPAILPFPFRVRFNFAANAEPVWQEPESATVKLDQAVFAGLSPGSVGLYQVNFRVPQPPPGAPACFIEGVQSNLTVTLAGGTSSDGVKLCVGVGDASVIAWQYSLAH